MQYRMPRREFILGMGVAAVTAVSSFPHEKVWAAEALYPPMDLSYFDTPISPGPSEIHFGYAAITWGGNDRQAIADIAALGFHGIQLRANVIKEFGSAAELRNLLEKHQLKMVALSSGGEAAGLIFGTVDLARIPQVREKLPSLHQRREEIYAQTGAFTAR